MIPSRDTGCIPAVSSPITRNFFGEGKEAGIDEPNGTLYPHAAAAEDARADADHGTGTGAGDQPAPVSYTHLDVYKRQGHALCPVSSVGDAALLSKSDGLLCPRGHRSVGILSEVSENGGAAPLDFTNARECVRIKRMNLG